MHGRGGKKGRSPRRSTPSSQREGTKPTAPQMKLPNFQAAPGPARLFFRKGKKKL